MENDVEEGQYKEQKAMDDYGGLENLDNKSNEVNKEKMDRLKEKYENNKEIQIENFWKWFSDNSENFGEFSRMNNYFRY